MIILWYYCKVMASQQIDGQLACCILAIGSIVIVGVGRVRKGQSCVESSFLRQTAVPPNFWNKQLYSASSQLTAHATSCRRRRRLCYQQLSREQSGQRIIVSTEFPSTSCPVVCWRRPQENCSSCRWSSVAMKSAHQRYEIYPKHRLPGLVSMKTTILYALVAQILLFIPPKGRKSSSIKALPSASPPASCCRCQQRRLSDGC